jgi:hypothetical protein
MGAVDLTKPRGRLVSLAALRVAEAQEATVAALPRAVAHQQAMLV